MSPLHTELLILTSVFIAIVLEIILVVHQIFRGFQFQSCSLYIYIYIKKKMLLIARLKGKSKFLCSLNVSVSCHKKRSSRINTCTIWPPRRASLYHRSRTIHDDVDIVTFMDSSWELLTLHWFHFTGKRGKYCHCQFKVTLLMPRSLLRAGGETPCNGTV